LESGDQYNVCTFFTGFGASTSPDGFTANYGKNVIGIAERVICLFLPYALKAGNYDQILAKIASRILLSRQLIPKRIQIAVELVNKSGKIKKPKELLEYLELKLDSKLKLSVNEIAEANRNEVKCLRRIIADQKDHIKELTINPAKTALFRDSQKLAAAEKERKKLNDLINKMTLLSSQKEMTEAINEQKDEVIATLKSDYVKIFGTLTDQILALENEIKGISESTQGLVNDLNRILAEKIQRINELESEIKTLKAMQLL